MMFSATSLADARSAAGSACQRQRALDRARRHRVAAPAQEQLRRQRRHRAPVAGEIGRPGGTRCGPPRRRRSPAASPSTRAGELGAHAGLVDLARARSPPGSPARRGGVPRDRARPSRFRSDPMHRRHRQCVGNPFGKRCAGKAFVPPALRRDPGAARSRSSRRPPRGSVARGRRRRRRGRTGSRTSRRRRRRVGARPVDTSNTSARSTGGTATVGAITARRAEPVTDQRRRVAASPRRRGRGVGDGAQHRRGRCPVAEPLDPHRLASERGRSASG